MLAVNDPLLSLRLVVYCGALGVVHAEAHARLDEDAVRIVAHDRHRCHVGDREVVVATHAAPLNPPRDGWVRWLCLPDWS